MNKVRKYIRVFIRSIPIIALWCVLFTKNSDTKFYINTHLIDKLDIVATSLPDDKHIVTFYALGDWGTGDKHQKLVAKTLKQDLLLENQENIKPFVLGLGDNIYDSGLSPAPFQSQIVQSLLQEKFGDIYQNIGVVFHTVPGNHDYYQSDNDNMWGGRIHEETSAESIYSENTKNNPVFKSYPIHHENIKDSNDATEHEELQKKSLWELAKPQKIKLDTLDNDILIIALDTQIWITLYQQNKIDAIQLYKEHLTKIIQESPAKWKILYGHHPVVSNGVHGGFHSTREWAWSGARDRIPSYLRWATFLWGSSFSVIGDKIFTNTFPYTQDINNLYYQKYIKDIREIIQKNNIDFIISGHDHNLQFIQLTQNSFQIVSGSAGKTNSVTHSPNTILSHEAPGFVKFSVYKKKINISFISVNLDNAKMVTNAIFTIKK